MKLLIINIIFLTLVFLSPLRAKEPFSKERLDQLSGVRTSAINEGIQWDEKYNKKQFIYGKVPAKFLSENVNYLKSKGKVLDLGMGEGRNAIFLAQKGFKVTGIDISSVAISKAHQLAKEMGTSIQAISASLDNYDFPKESFDAIICFYYVNKNLLHKMKEWLKPNGVIVFEAYTLEQKNSEPSLKNEAQTSFVKAQELLSLFKGFKILKFEEPDFVKEFRSSIIVKKI